MKIKAESIWLTSLLVISLGLAGIIPIMGCTCYLIINLFCFFLLLLVQTFKENIMQKTWKFLSVSGLWFIRAVWRSEVKGMKLANFIKLNNVTDVNRIVYKKDCWYEKSVQTYRCWKAFFVLLMTVPEVQISLYCDFFCDKDEVFQVNFLLTVKKMSETKLYISIGNQIELK